MVQATLMNTGEFQLKKKNAVCIIEAELPSLWCFYKLTEPFILPRNTFLFLI